MNLRDLRAKMHLDRGGVSMAAISSVAESIGFRTMGASVRLGDFIHESPVPCIVHWNNMHFIVVYKIKKDKIYVADPAFGLVTYTYREFAEGWAPDKIEGADIMSLKGRVLLLDPTRLFYDLDDKHETKEGLSSLFHHMNRYRGLISQLIVGMIVGSILQLILPFLTQSIVDVGINQHNLNFIYLVLIAQVALFVGQTALTILRSWILLHINSRINISLISDFLMKLMRLPMNFFDSRTAGDIVKRIDDHARIEAFLTGTTIAMLFSIVNLVIFGGVLAYYNTMIFLTFFAGSAIYVVWAILFLNKRRELDYKNFALESANKGSILQLIFGVQEIKLNSAERQKRWDWESIQAKLFKNNIRILHLEQYQNAGGALINETKNVIIAVIAAKAVIDGQMSLGMMLAVQFILGQLNLPLVQLIGFLHTTQNAAISLERLREVQDEPDEGSNVAMDIDSLAPGESIQFRNVQFRYGGDTLPPVIDNINLDIPANKITAIVGPSGGGKTTLVKLLLKLYEPTSGEIYYGKTRLSGIRPERWRQMCGAVMQDGYIFSDTIAGNIAVSGEAIDYRRVVAAAKIANIHSFIEGLPLGYNTVIGNDGTNLSQGQKQRILIARVVYKDPPIIFLDEATNALDANNESEILSNLAQFLPNHTVIIIAHRLSTVRQADQIILLEHGKIAEVGTHQELYARDNGAYRQLVKRQTEISI